MQNGMRNGSGVYRYQTGDVFEGQWTNNVRNGGRIAFSNGDVYEGDLVNNRKHGQGRYRFLNDGDYVG